MKVEDKQETKKKNDLVLERALNMGLGKAGLKLSDFIDEKFLEDDMDCIAEETSSNKAKMCELLAQLEYESQEGLFNSLNPQKRQKLQTDSSLQPTHIILSPLLAIFLHQSELLTSENWKNRQVAACQLRVILQNIESLGNGLPYFVVVKDEATGQMAIKQERSG